MESVKRVLVIGYGEAGKPLFEIIRGVYPLAAWLDINPKHIEPFPDVMHITYPEDSQEGFVELSKKYIQAYRPKLTLIESTVTPGTTCLLHEALLREFRICHSPIRGNVAEGMKKGILQYTKFIGGVDIESANMAKDYYESLGLRTKACKSPVETELGKLFETTYRGIMMSWFQEINRICNKARADYGEVVEFLATTEKEGKQARPIFHPGVIGGHCIIPNASKLLSFCKSKFVEALIESNELRRHELTSMSREHIPSNSQVT